MFTNLSHVPTKTLKITGKSEKNRIPSILSISNVGQLVFWGPTLTKLAPSSIAATLIRCVLSSPMTRFCLIRIWIQLWHSTSGLAPRFLLWPPGLVDRWGSQVQEWKKKKKMYITVYIYTYGYDDKVDHPWKEPKSILFAGIPWWLADGLRSEPRNTWNTKKGTMNDELWSSPGPPGRKDNRHCFNPKVQFKNLSTRGQMVNVKHLSAQPSYIRLQDTEVCVVAFPSESSRQQHGGLALSMDESEDRIW